MSPPSSSKVITHASPLLSSTAAASASAPPEKVMTSNLTIETEDAFSSLLDFAANNDVDGFKLSIERDPSAIDEIGLWYGRKKGSNQMVLEPRTPLMVAATYGSLDVLNLIISSSAADVSRSCGPDKITALHCATSGGSINAVDAVKILIGAGADPDCVDGNGLRPADVIVVSPMMPHIKGALLELLGNSAASGENNSNHHHPNLRVLTSTVNSTNSPPLSSPVEDGGSPSSGSMPSPTAVEKFPYPLPSSATEKKEYPVDPSLPDIKNSIYTTDEFRMFSFKVRPCSRAYSHDWTECPFVHPGENARRRDPRKYHYSCVPCPDFRKGACRRGDLCEYAHGVFECWLHPAQYRTRLCKDGTSCARRVCFFAHTTEELRPLYVNTGSAMPSPRSAASAAMVMDMAAALNLLPGSPSSVSAMLPSPFAGPLSPSANGMWPQPSVPALHLPGSNLQSSRLRSSLNARDFSADELSMLQELEHQQLLSDISSFSSIPARMGSPAGGHPCRPRTLTPSNLDDLFSAEVSLSPRYNSDQGAVFSPSHKSAVLNQFQLQQSMLSPINTNAFSPKTIDAQQMPGHSSLLQASLGISSPGRMSPRAMESLSPMGSRLSAFAQREQQQHQLRSLSSRELGSAASASMGSPVNNSSPWSKWGSSSGKLEWAVNGEELGRLRRSNSFELAMNGDEPDVSWVQSLVKESPTDAIEKCVVVPTPSGSDDPTAPNDIGDHTVLGAWLEQMQIDQKVPH